MSLCCQTGKTGLRRRSSRQRLTKPGAARVRRSGPSRITATAVSSEISSALLFLIAEAYPDAAEAAKRINPNAEESGPIERSLLTALQMLAEGRLGDIFAEPLPETTMAPSVDRAVEALLTLLLRGVRALAQQLSASAAAEDPAIASQLFQRVKALCIDELPDAFGDGRQAYSVFSGPLHLANLLIAAERDLGGAALSQLPSPTGVDAAAWSRIVRRMGRSRPFLGATMWRLSSGSSWSTGGRQRSAFRPVVVSPHSRNSKLLRRCCEVIRSHSWHPPMRWWRRP